MTHVEKHELKGQKDKGNENTTMQNFLKGERGLKISEFGGNWAIWAKVVKIRRPKQENEIYSKRKIVMAIHGTGTKLGVGMEIVKQIVCTGISFFTDKEREREISLKHINMKKSLERAFICVGSLFQPARRNVVPSYSL
jgi:hypothetical protein